MKLKHISPETYILTIYSSFSITEPYFSVFLLYILLLPACSIVFSVLPCFIACMSKLFPKPNFLTDYMSSDSRELNGARIQGGTLTQSSGDQFLVLCPEKGFKDTTNSKQESASLIKVKVYTLREKYRQIQSVLPELSGLWAFVFLGARPEDVILAVRMIL